MVVADLTWDGAARFYEALADKHAVDGGRTGEYIFTRHGLDTWGEVVLYCWIKHWEEVG